MSKKKPAVIIPPAPIDVPTFAVIPPPTMADVKAYDHSRFNELLADQERADITCPTCGTAKTANRCEVCGHQNEDT